MVKLITKLTILFFAFVTYCLQAQNFQGEAIYQSKRFFEEGSFKISSSDQNPAFEKELQESMMKAFEKTYELHFNTTETLYFEQEKLEAPQNTNGMMVVMSTGTEKTYRNIKEKKVVEETEFFSKEFLVSDSLRTFNWKIQNEQKKIGNYTCFKASVTIPVSAEQLKNYEKNLKEQEKNGTQFMVIKEPKARVIEAWYAPEIPVNVGPDEYWGLPGLIMEVHDGDLVLLCTKVTLNPKDKKKIESPKKGKKVTQEAYQKIVEEKLESMKDGDGTIQIMIGG
uniref:GLPGLI family protein n=1 Tax=Flavobacterium sp. TaxID=239 RepID=UPI0040498D70